MTYEDDNSCNLMIDDMSDDEDMPDLALTYESDSEDESDLDSNLLRNRRPVVTRECKPKKRTRVSVIFSLEDENGNITEYL